MTYAMNFGLIYEIRHSPKIFVKNRNFSIKL